MGNLRRMYSWGRERFFTRSHPSDVRSEFEKLFQGRIDPWNYSSSYEQTKYERTLALIPDGMKTALEIGCAEGHFTVQLAPHVRTLTACDIADTALERAARRCEALPHVRFIRLDVASDPIPGQLDLIVCSEMLYYVGSVGLLRQVAKKIAHALNRNGYLVMAHMNLLVDDPDRPGFDWQLPFGGRVIGDVFQGIPILRLVKEVRTPLYRIQLFQRISLLQRWLGGRKSESEIIVLNEQSTNLEPAVANHAHCPSLTSPLKTTAI